MALSPLSVANSSGVAVNVEALLGATGNTIPLHGLDSTRVAYRAAANFTPQPTAAVTLITITGSATRTVRIKRVGIAGVSTGSAQQILALQRTSALGAGGTLVAPTVSLLDRGAGATYPAATAVVNHWTTTLKAAGTPVGGPMNAQNIQTTVTAVPITSPGASQALFPEFGVPIGSAIVLRGVADFIEVQNIGAANLGAGTVYAYFVEWEEDLS